MNKDKSNKFEYLIDIKNNWEFIAQIFILNYIVKDIERYLGMNEIWYILI